MKNPKNDKNLLFYGILETSEFCEVKTVGKIIAITNQKGGVGKTTTAVNISACAAAKGKKVLLVDIDPQGNASSGIGIVKEDLEQCVYDCLIDDKAPTEVILHTAYKKLDVLPATIQLAGASVELVNMEQREYRLQAVLEQVREKYDYIFIDCPPSLGLLTLNGLLAADSVIIPVQCEFYALEGLSQLIKTIESVRESLKNSLSILGVVLTMYDGRTNLSIQVADEVKKFFGSKVYRTIIPRSVRLSEAPSYGEPIIVYDPKSKSAEAYEKLTKEVMANA